MKNIKKFLQLVAIHMVILGMNFSLYGLTQTTTPSQKTLFEKIREVISFDPIKTPTIQATTSQNDQDSGSAKTQEPNTLSNLDTIQHENQQSVDLAIAHLNVDKKHL